MTYEEGRKLFHEVYDKRNINKMINGIEYNIEMITTTEYIVTGEDDTQFYNSFSGVLNYISGSFNPL